MICCEGSNDDFASVTDIDGNTHNVVTIGDQVRMAGNLKVTRYSNGDAIPFVAEGSERITLGSGAFARFRNDDSLVSVFGLH